jgi:hypothetical protein
VSFLGAVLILVAGLIVVFGEIYASKDLERSQAWNETQGEIEVFMLSRTYVGDFIPSIRYRFQVAGRDYAGESIRVGGRLSFPSKRLALEMENAYQVGNRVSVFYDPQDPEKCCLDREETAGGHSAMLWGLTLAGLGVFLLFQAFGK